MPILQFANRNDSNFAYLDSMYYLNDLNWNMRTNWVSSYKNVPVRKLFIVDINSIRFGPLCNECFHLSIQLGQSRI